MSRSRLLVLVCSALLVLGVMATPASAQDSPPIFDASKMELEFQSPENAATNSDLAFWGDYAFVGYYTGDAGNPPTTPPLLVDVISAKLPGPGINRKMMIAATKAP